MPTSNITLKDLRRYAIVNTLFAPTTLARAINTLGFVQADPIRAPARAQDLILRHRVKNYHAGDLERHYGKLNIEEDFFVNYGFVPRAIHALMHPRTPRTIWDVATKKRAAAILDFVCAHKEVHPREVDAHFAHGAAANNWGGSSNATTHLLDSMHYRGLIRVARRDKGIRIYAPALRDHERSIQPLTDREQTSAVAATLDELIDVVVKKYAPIPAGGFSGLVGRLQYGVPQWRGEITAAIKRAKQRLNHTCINGVDWYWPLDAKVGANCHEIDDQVRLLAPFDPIVWDRKRFELFWNWPYRFEAYTPAAKRKLGYYALPLLWREQVIGWANVSVQVGGLQADIGYVAGVAPRGVARELAAELERLRGFLALSDCSRRT